MAIARGAGTEIIRQVMLNTVDATWQTLIFGVQYHIYTVLSIVVHANSVNTAGNYIRARINGYDITSGATANLCYLFQNDMNQYDTFVWNDKFSFNGHEPIDFTAGMDSAVKQDAVADQGSAVNQELQIAGEHPSDNFDVICTFIDQNNA